MKEFAGREENFPQLRERVAEFLDKIAGYRSCTVYLPIRELLAKELNSVLR